MKEFKGTPGPWQVVDTYDDYHEYSINNPHIIVWDGDEQAFGPVCDMGQIGDMNYAEAFANATLIAAAPELSDALQLLLSDFESIVKDAGSHLSVTIAKEAINKALDINQLNPPPAR